MSFEERADALYQDLFGHRPPRRDAGGDPQQPKKPNMAKQAVQGAIKQSADTARRIAQAQVTGASVQAHHRDRPAASRIRERVSIIEETPLDPTNQTIIGGVDDYGL